MEIKARMNPFGLSLNGRVYDNKMLNEYLEQFKKKFGRLPQSFGEVEHKGSFLEELKKLTFNNFEKEISTEGNTIKLTLFTGVKLNQENLIINYLSKENAIEVDYEEEKTTRYYKRTLPENADFSTMKAFILDEGGLEIVMEKKAGE